MKKKFEKRIIIAIYILSLVLLILGLSYASVPLYQLFCQATGFGGTIQKTDYNSKIFIENNDKSNMDLQTNVMVIPKNAKQNISTNKYITIHFNADVSDNLSWTFKPTINKIKVYPGDTALTFYIAKNHSNQPISGISTYHVTPAKVGIYFNKIQCFCFEEQRLKANESIEMPVLFFLDNDFKDDPKMQDVDSITLSYTFYKSDFS